MFLPEFQKRRTSIRPRLHPWPQIIHQKSKSSNSVKMMILALLLYVNRESEIQSAASYLIPIDPIMPTSKNSEKQIILGPRPHGNTAAWIEGLQDLVRWSILATQLYKLSIPKPRCAAVVIRRSSQAQKCHFTTLVYCLLESDWVHFLVFFLQWWQRLY